MQHTSRWHWRALAGAAALCAGCMQGPTAGLLAQGSAGAVQPGTQAQCRGAAGAGWQAAQRDLRAQGLMLRRACSGDAAYAPQLVVLDAVRASEVLRGPLADGEAVDLGDATAAGARSEVSPDVAFNRDWVQAVLLRHQVRAQAAGGSHPALFQAVELATR